MKHLRGKIFGYQRTHSFCSFGMGYAHPSCLRRGCPVLVSTSWLIVSFGELDEMERYHSR